MNISRDYYFSRKKSLGIGETDELLEIANRHKVTKGLVELITYTAQKDGSFEEASETLKKYLNLDISDKQIQIISEEVGKLLFEKDLKEAEILFGEERNNEIYTNIYKEENNILVNRPSTLYVFADGSMVSMREKETWKEIKLGLVVRHEDIQIRNSTNMKLYKKEYISYLGNKDTFKKLLYVAAIKAGYNSNTKVVAIGDGAIWLWSMFEELFPGCIKILDYYHFSENVNKYAKCMYGEDEVSAKKWVNNILGLANENKSDEIIDEIKKIELEKNRKATTVNLIKYVIEKKEMITYKKFKDKGYIIGSGAIESGNKLVVQKRLKQAGMHWSIEGAQYMATLRCKYKSDLWHKVIRSIDEEYLRISC
jgi:hypothetical protein